MIYIFLSFGYLMVGLFGSIIVSSRVSQVYSENAGFGVGLAVLTVMWSLALYNLHIGFKESMK